jgi:hypothetical protein
MSTLMVLLRGLLAIVGRLFGQTLNGRRDVDNKRRELRIQFLVEAWRNLERAARRARLDETRELEQALADIQLFGTPDQADQAGRVARSMSEARTETATLDELLEALRADLREELRLGRANARLEHLRGAADLRSPLGATC